MNKHECVKYCLDCISKSWEENGGPKDYLKRHQTYLDCKAFCEKEGYVGETFAQLWNKAVDEFERRMSK